jgi:segregation and condensation protein A
MADPVENDPGQLPPPSSQRQHGTSVSDEGLHKGLTGLAEGSMDPDKPEPLNPATQDIVEDPVEILVGLAERGEIDPWNINIIEVTDRFLSELERRRQLNLQVSGRTLFYAATLLRMKSEHLGLQSGPDEEEPGEEDESFGADFDMALDSEIDYQGRLGPIEKLEHEIQRRLDRKNMRKSPVTLFELIIELKNIEKEERRRRRLTDSSDDLIYADDVVGIAHDEGNQESAMTVLEECLDCIELEKEMTLVELCQKLGWGIPEVYIPLLFLSHEGRCSLRQEEFFGDVFVQICRAEGEEPTPEVLPE